MSLFCRVSMHYSTRYFPLCWIALFQFSLLLSSRKANLLINLFSLMRDAGIPDIAIEPDKAVQKVINRHTLTNSLELTLSSIQAERDTQTHRQTDRQRVRLPTRTPCLGKMERSECTWDFLGYCSRLLKAAVLKIACVFMHVVKLFSPCYRERGRDSSKWNFTLWSIRDRSVIKQLAYLSSLF